VTLGQIETTTILTNNRAFAKVSPSATMEFDLPQRDIVLTEAMRGSKALMQEYGNLIKDPSFIAGAAMFQGTPPGLNAAQSPLQTIPSEYGGTRPEPGAALQALIPEPAVYKFETGTGFEIRPVIQPDGHSIVYGFDYMYTTNVREPVRADEKHLGRVKRHLVHTDVQTSSYELREVSKYMVALKASRTSRGVPLFEDVPLIGGLFRPLPSQESSLQQNIILASSVIYPTLFDLMGLRWSPYADDLSSENLPRQKSRENEIKRRYRSNLLQQARTAVNENIGGGVQLPPELRSDYHEPEHLFERTTAPAEELLPPGYPTPAPQPTERPGTSRLRSTPLRLESDPNPVERDPALPGREHLRDATLPDPTLPETKPNEEALPLPGVSRRPASRPGAPKPSRPVASTSNPRPTERAVPASRPQQPMASRPAHRDSAVQPAGYEEPAPRPALRPSAKPPMTSGPIRGSGPSQRR
jgi:hypothetical protein